MYNNYPKTIHNKRKISNLTVRLSIINDIKTNFNIFQKFILRAGQSPEDIALEFYNDEELFWLVLMVNNISDPYHGWYMTDSDLDTYVKDKYGPENVYNIHHYETITGSVYPVGTYVDFGAPFSKSVTNYVYEESLNEKRQRIKLLKPSYLPQLLSEIEQQLQNVR